MFGFEDFAVFLRAFFVIFPLVTIIHVLGHYFFAKLSGCHVKMIVGCGKKLFSIGPLEFRMFYFWYGGCEFTSIKATTKARNILIYLGGSIFNGLSILLMYSFIFEGIIESSNVTYQFLYFSIYTVFFALMPMDYPDGSPSDGKAILKIMRNKEIDHTTDCQWKQTS
ncbi:site-2 protease family protein [Bacillus weihaiensis]|uniref:Peptidase M50 domain-containing protein n=1 Tax=Bacillus weihaiensis TaxID=1547283 RepID=A0A1L3MVJ9_9BACI|nr:site-2 protease family protein [Bacillus weihaiensis]APH06363.1 hypothetical protein A9C19_17405 [Bacillus weihaiensis]